MKKEDFIIMAIVFIIFLIGISKFVSDKYNLPFVVVFGLVTIIQGTLVMSAIPFMDMSLAKSRERWLESRKY